MLRTRAVIPENMTTAGPSLRRASVGGQCGLFFTALISVFAAGPEGNWILSRDQQAVADHVNSPICYLREDGAQFQHLIFDKEGHNFSETHLFLLAVGEAGNFLALNKKLAVRRLDVM
jgi:hypothetical protein